MPRVTCRICEINLQRHDDWDCCPCCGTRRRHEQELGGRDNCPEHGHWCEHWEYMYLAALAKRAQCLDGGPVLTMADVYRLPMGGRRSR
jgi:hypothetical protein